VGVQRIDEVSDAEELDKRGSIVGIDSWLAGRDI